MSPIEFPDEHALIGRRGDVGLMVWSTRTFGDSNKPEDGRGSKGDAFYPDSLWLESEMVAIDPARRKFSLAWSKNGDVLGRVRWDAGIVHGDAGGCSIAGTAFEVGQKLPSLSPQDLIERVTRACAFARTVSQDLPCVLSLDRVSLHEVHAMAGREAAAMDQISQIAGWQGLTGFGSSSMAKHEHVARSAKASWVAKDPDGYEANRLASRLRRLTALVMR